MIRLFLCVLLVTGLWGCSSAESPPLPCESQLLEKQSCSGNAPQAERSGKVEVRFFIDGTDSMKGYPNAVRLSGKENAYLHLLRALRDGLQEFPQSSRRIYKFGTQVQLQPENSLEVAGRDPNFYSGVGLYTDIEQVLRENFVPARPKRNTLSVIVTDLMQRDTNVTGLVEKLKRYLSGKDQAVGLVGIESDFDGWVYDLDSQEAKKYLRPGGGPRPVYGLVIGTFADVAFYFDALQRASSTLEKQGKFVIFTGALLAEPLAFFASAPVQPEGEGGLVSQELLADGRTFWFTVSGQPERVDFELCPTYRLRPYVPAFDGEGDWRARVKGLGTVDSKPRDLSAVAMVRAAPDACSAKEVDVARANTSTMPPRADALGLQVQLDMAPIYAAPNRDFFFALRFQPAPHRFPDWWQTWNTDDGPVQPTRTLHLKQFLRSMENVALASKEHPEMQMTFYVRK